MWHNEARPISHQFSHLFFTPSGQEYLSGSARLHRGFTGGWRVTTVIPGWYGRLTTVISGLGEKRCITVNSRVYPGCIGCIPPRVYTSLCTQGVYLPMYHPTPPWVYHHPTHCTGVPGRSVHHAQCPGEGALGSKEEKPMGEGG